jgi:hypothetical protein
VGEYDASVLADGSKRFSLSQRERVGVRENGRDSCRFTEFHRQVI